MSLSPSTSVSNDEIAVKRRRTNGDSSSIHLLNNNHPSPATPGQSQSSPHIPKRGARACTACRKGKNRCEGEAPCRRCAHNGIACVFEKPEKKQPPGLPGASVERLSRLEGQYLVLQSQMIGMQSSLDRILTAVQSNQQQQPQNNMSVNQLPPMYPPPARDGSGFAVPSRNGYDMASPGSSMSGERSRFPPLPGFAPPPHKYATYGIVPSTAPSSDDESDDHNEMI